MNTIIGSTTSETNMIKAIQRAVRAAEDGMIGGETMAAVAAKLGADCFPLTLRIYGQPTIIARDIVVCNPVARLKGYSNSLSRVLQLPEKAVLHPGETGARLCARAPATPGWASLRPCCTVFTPASLVSRGACPPRSSRTA